MTLNLWHSCFRSSKFPVIIHKVQEIINAILITMIIQMLFLYSYLFTSPFCALFNPSFISIQEASECSSRFNSLETENTSCTFCVVSARTNFIESWKMLLKSRQLKQLLIYLQLFSSISRRKRREGIMLFDILHISKHDPSDVSYTQKIRSKFSMLEK